MDLTYDYGWEIEWSNTNKSFLNIAFTPVEGHANKIDEYILRMNEHNTTKLY